MVQRTRVLFGGMSSEHRVSVASAQNLCGVLEDAEFWFIARDGRIYDCPRALLLAHVSPFERDFAPADGPLAPDFETALRGCTAGGVFFLALHGGDGEDGTLQAVLERTGFAFTGSGSAASAAAFDKERAKAIVARRGIRTAQSTVVRGGENEIRAALRRLLAARGKWIAKPVADGSSIGLHRLSSAADLEPVAGAIAKADQAYMVEEFVEGTELTVGVIDEAGSAVALPPSEIRLEGAASFDFAGKYLGKGTREITPAEVPDAVIQEAQRIAAAAHVALGCEGYSRTDLIQAPGGITFLETNTLPGLTRASFIPQQLAASGRTLHAFVEAQLRLAVERRDRSRR